MTEIRESIIKNLKYICDRKGLKQKDIAKCLGVSEGSVSNWFKGTNSIDVDNLYALCQFLGVSLDQIFGIVPIIPADFLQPDEVTLLSGYRSLSSDGKKYIFHQLAVARLAYGVKRF